MLSTDRCPRLHQLLLLINLCLAFFEWPSSFSVTSDIRDQPNRIEFSHYLLMSIEGVTLLWLLIFISAKVNYSSVDVKRRSSDL